MTHIYDVIDCDELRQAIELKHVREQHHPTEPLAILNYTDTCAFDQHWTDTTLQCRGLIYNTTDGEIVARPFPKFFNYGQPGAANIALDAEVEVTDKIDGSLGILYRRPSDGYLAVATRGSFASEQALHATQVFRERYDGFTPLPEDTILFEIVYPQNRIVLNYGDRDDLVLLGSVEIATGYISNPRVTQNFHGWPGPKADHFGYATLADALAAEPRPNAEGYVIRQRGTDRIVKLKQADYISLHRVLTHTSARTLWEFLAVNACKHLIERDIHWGSFIGLDPARAAEILAVEGDWTATILDGVPDEFYTWVRDTIARISHAAATALSEAHEFALRAQMQAGADRLALFKIIEPHPFNKSIMRMVTGGSDRDLFLKAWRSIEPGIELPFARSEDAA